MASSDIPSVAKAGHRKLDTRTVPEFDLSRYLGLWYEIARFDHRFERNLVGVTAEYSLLPDGKIRVVNSGYVLDFNGRYKQAAGKAKQPDLSEPGQLKVSFFLWFYSDYNIMVLDEDYGYALVGSNSDRYLWILSRTPSLPMETFNRLVDQAYIRGYDTDRLLWVPQKTYND